MMTWLRDNLCTSKNTKMATISQQQGRLYKSQFNMEDTPGMDAYNRIHRELITDNRAHYESHYRPDSGQSVATCHTANQSENTSMTDGIYRSNTQPKLYI